MAQVLTNNTGLQYAREASLGVLPGSPDWKVLEPNTIGTTGAQITKVPRSPISKLRQRRKGTIVDLDAALDYEADQTLDSLVDFTEAFLFSTATNSDMTFRGVSVTGTGYTIPAATAAQAAKFQYTAAGPISLIHALGYAIDGNNSPLTVKEIDADVVASATEITAAGLAIETAPTNAEVSIAGIRPEVGDLDFTLVSNIGTVTSGNGASITPIDFTTLGLTAGQKIHVGGLTATNRFGSTAGGSNDSFGSMRILTIAAGAITGDKVDATLTDSDGTDTGSAGTEVACDLLWGRFVRNVQSDHADYVAISHQFEQAFPNLYETDPPTPVADPDGFEYTIGALANTMTWAMPLTDKSTATFAFVGTNADDIVNNASRKTNAATARLPLFTGALNTSSNFFRLIIAEVDDTGLTSDFSDMTSTFNNNVNAEKVLGLLGARYMNNGNFEVDIETVALFTDPNVAARIKSNTTVTMDWLLRNDDGAVSVDIPSCTLGDGAKNLPVDESAKINLSVEAFVDPILLTSVGVSFFPVYPTA